MKRPWLHSNDRVGTGAMRQLPLSNPSHRSQRGRSNTLFYEHQLKLYESLIRYLKNDCGPSGL